MGCLLWLSTHEVPHEWLKAAAKALGDNDYMYARVVRGDPDALKQLLLRRHCTDVVMQLPLHLMARLLDAAVEAGARVYLPVTTPVARIEPGQEPPPGTEKICKDDTCVAMALTGLRRVDEIVIRGPFIKVNLPVPRPAKHH